MEISDLADKVVEAFETDDLDEAVTLLLSAFWETTGTQDELLDFLKEVGKDLATNGHAKQAEFCTKMYASYDAYRKTVKKTEPQWFVAETLRITKWCKVPGPTRFAEEYFERVEQRREVALTLLGILVENRAERGRQLREESRRQERCETVRRIGRKAGLIAAAPFTAGTSLLFLALEE
jgi:hypothetical protein